MNPQYVSLATFNLRNLVSPGVRYFGRYHYSPERYAEKLNWLADQLFRLDADVVCLQEVFHAAALDELIDRYHTRLDATHSQMKARRDQYSAVYFAPNQLAEDGAPQPGLAILSRRPITEYRAVQDLSEAPVELDGNGLSYRLDHLTRPMQVARVELPFGTEAWLFHAHLKSETPPLISADTLGRAGSDPFQDRALGACQATLQQTGEALAIRREILGVMQRSDDPVIVAGGLQRAAQGFLAGEAPPRHLKPEQKRPFWDVELYSAAEAHTRRTPGTAMHTHIRNGVYDTADHVLVSQAFFYRNRDRIGDIAAVTLFSDHLLDDSLREAPANRPSSDHALVRVELSIDPARLEPAMRRALEADAPAR